MRDGLDPVFERRKQREVIPTFKQATTSTYDERKATFGNANHRINWMRSVERFAFPLLGDNPVNEITGPMIVRTLKPIWTTKPETARRVLQRIATVLAWAVAHGHREHEAPLKAIRMGLPPQPKGKKHFAAVPYSDAPEALRKLRDQPESNARNCLAFIIWTACRSGEARGAKWDEVDLEAATWTIPAGRIKMRVQHVVPLSPPALALLQRLYAVRSNEYLFPGLPKRNSVNRDKGIPLAVQTLLKALAEVAPDVTVHGWRSTFRDWASEETAFPSEVAEKAFPSNSQCGRAGLPPRGSAGEAAPADECLVELP